MPYINIDIDLDEFNTAELIEELDSRLKYNQIASKQINEWIKEIGTNVHKPINLSMLDEMKIDFLINNLHRISINDLENLLK